MNVKTDTPVKKGSSTPEALAQLEAANAAKKAAPPAANPLAAPTVTDELMQKARRIQFLRATQGLGRRASFLSGPVGDLRVPTMNKTQLLGR